MPPPNDMSLVGVIIRKGCEIRVRTGGGISSHMVYALLFSVGMEEEDETNAEFSDTVSYDIRVMR